VVYIKKEKRHLAILQICDTERTPLCTEKHRKLVANLTTRPVELVALLHNTFHSLIKLQNNRAAYAARASHQARGQDSIGPIHAVLHLLLKLKIRVQAAY